MNANEMPGSACPSCGIDASTELAAAAIDWLDAPHNRLEPVKWKRFEEAAAAYRQRGAPTGGAEEA